MKKDINNPNIAKELGIALRAARDAKGFTRLELGAILNVSFETIRYWESGKGVVGDIGFIPHIDKALDISYSGILNKVINGQRLEMEGKDPASASFCPGPISCKLNHESSDKVDSESYLAVPVVSSRVLLKPLQDGISGVKINDWTLIPASWVNGSRNLFAIKANDSAATACVSLQSTVVLDLSKHDIEKLSGAVIACKVRNGIKFRKVSKHTKTGAMVLTGLPQSSSLTFDSAKHRVIGVVVAVQGKPING